MAPTHAARAAILIAVVAFGCSASGVYAHADSFDTPVRKTVVDLGPSRNLMPGDPQHVQLSCSYYPGLMVKELDDPGMEGARWVTVTLFLKAHPPACRLAHGPKERFIAKDSWGFLGVKGPLLFLTAADGEDGGLPFRIVEWKTGKSLFKDSAALPYYGGPGFDFERTADGKLSLQYLRVVDGGCSIPNDGQNCWNILRANLGLAPSDIPACTGYKGEKTDQPIALADLETHSALQYPVEVKLLPRPSIRAIAGDIKCRPVD
jgi:hypothetical protein